jgi:glycerophosphoryl diester phosphodiesterase
MSTTNATRPTRRIGHKGADLIAPGNTADSFHAALAAGVDMIEFDVLAAYPDGHGELYLAHDYEDIRRRRDSGTLLTLDAGLAIFASEAFGAVELDVDLKLPGYEDRAVAALRAHGLLERTLVSTMETSSLRVLREIAPELRTGWSIPKVRGNPLDHPVKKYLAYGMAVTYRAGLPVVAPRAIRDGRCDALMVHHMLVTQRLADAVVAAGGELYVWTVDDAAEIQRLIGWGVAGVITNDPRLFDAR